MDAPWRIRTDLIQGPPGPGKYLTAGAAWTPGAVLYGGVVSTTLTVAGAVLGQPAVAALNPALVAGAFLVAQVTAANTVRVDLYNFSGGTITLGAGTVQAFVLVQG